MCIHSGFFLISYNTFNLQVNKKILVILFHIMFLRVDHMPAIYWPPEKMTMIFVTLFWMTFLLPAQCRKQAETPGGENVWLAYIEDSLQNCSKEIQSSATALKHHMRVFQSCFSLAWEMCSRTPHYHHSLTKSHRLHWMMSLHCSHSHFIIQLDHGTFKLEIRVPAVFHVNITFTRFQLPGREQATIHVRITYI